MSAKEIGRRLCLLACLAVFCVIFFSVFPTGCLFKRLTGVPCPSCGMTRAWFAVLRLDLAGAFALHPLFWCVPLVGLLLAFGRGKVLFWGCVAAGALFLAVYLWRMAQYFPTVSPMDYDYTSLLARLMGWSAGG
ncbi:MAG: DUF2752 domain-containing protein [Oscillospiraceae bacterium]|nr:DUF2752 domain-containing protein [Oscillospiraceae bacterium]